MNKISFTAYVHRHRLRKDKTFSVNIRIGYKSKYDFIETMYSVGKNELSKKWTIKNMTILDKCNAIISEYRQIIESINESESLTVKDIAEFIRNGGKPKEIDFLLFFREYNTKLKNENSPSLGIYKATYNHLRKYINLESFQIKNVTSNFLSGFEKYLSRKEVGSRGINLYLSRIRAVYNSCIDEYEEQGYTFNYPFRKYKIPNAKYSKTVALTKEQLRAIIDLDLSEKKRANIARNAFLCSLYLLGTNATDLYDLKTIKDGRIEYERNKTKSKRNDNAFISIKIEYEFQQIYKHVKSSKNDCVFLFSELYKNKPQFNKAINEGLKQIAKILNNQKETEFIFDFDFYDARRTIASVMRNKLNISKDDIAACLNHIDREHTTTDIYIEKDFAILDRCNRLFLDWLFK